VNKTLYGASVVGSYWRKRPTADFY
jgi:hypothetical protein